jgi:glycosyltransferase involved in cell wall biosynthesis
VPFSISAHAKDIYTSRPQDLQRKLRAARFTVTCTDAQPPAPWPRWHPTPDVQRMYHGIDQAEFHPARRQRGDSDAAAAPGRGTPAREEGARHAGRRLPASARARHAPAAARSWATAKSASSSRSASTKRVWMGTSRLIGKLAREQVIERYAQARVFVQPSRITADGDRDGIPNVLLEAMAMGLPVVASRVSGIPEVVRRPPQRPAGAEPDDAAALADAIA